MPPEQSRYSVFPSHEQKVGESHVSKRQYRLTLGPKQVNIEDVLVRTCNTTHDQPSLRSFKTCTAMRAIQIKELVREIADLRVTTLPDLQPAPDKYLIQIHAAATNFLTCFRSRENTSRNHLCHGSRAANSRERSKPCPLQRETPNSKWATKSLAPRSARLQPKSWLTRWLYDLNRLAGLTNKQVGYSIQCLPLMQRSFYGQKLGQVRAVRRCSLALRASSIYSQIISK